MSVSKILGHRKEKTQCFVLTLQHFSKWGNTKARLASFRQSNFHLLFMHHRQKKKNTISCRRDIILIKKTEIFLKGNTL